MENDLEVLEVEMPVSYVRVLHAVPNSPAVDLYVGDIRVADNLMYGQYTEYKVVPAGMGKVNVFESDELGRPIYTSEAVFLEGEAYTIVGTGNQGEVQVLVVPDTLSNVTEDRTMIRFVHLSTNTSAVDVTLPDGMILFEQVSYGQATEYLALPATVYTINIRAAGTFNSILTLPYLYLSMYKKYSIYAIGLQGGKPELVGILAIDKR